MKKRREKLAIREDGHEGEKPAKILEFRKQKFTSETLQSGETWILTSELQNHLRTLVLGGKREELLEFACTVTIPEIIRIGLGTYALANNEADPPALFYPELRLATDVTDLEQRIPLWLKLQLNAIADPRLPAQLREEVAEYLANDGFNNVIFPLLQRVAEGKFLTRKIREQTAKNAIELARVGYELHNVEIYLQVQKRFEEILVQITKE